MNRLLVFCVLFSTAALAQQKPTVLKGGKLLTISHGTIENGVLVMQNGKITAIGAEGSIMIPKDARVIDTRGMTIYPGLIDSEDNLGLTEISAEQSTNDLIESSDEIMNGVTNAIIAPDTKDTLPGQDSFVQLAGKTSQEMLLIRDIAMPLNFTGDQRHNESWDKRKFPQTRMGMAAQLRQAFLDAQDYAQHWADYEKKKSEAAQKTDDKDKKPDDKDKEKDKKPPTPPKRDLKLEALLPYLQGKKPIVLAAEEANDLQTAVSLAHEFNLKFVLSHISHSQSVLDYVAGLKVPVIVGPIYEDPKPYERYDTVYSLPAQLYKRGVKIIFASFDAHNVRNLPYQAGYATAFGLPYDEALKAITLNAAETWGVADQLGSLDAGKAANVVVANGDPLDLRTDVKQVFIAGKEIPMTSRQTRLRDQYSGQ
jgi:imidazolonepropionase-like amidohydrolase